MRGLASGLILLLVGCSTTPSPTPAGQTPLATASPTASPAGPEQATIVARVPLPRPDAQPAFEGQYATTRNAIWIADDRGAFLVRVDTNSNKVTSNVQIDPPFMAASDDQLWMIGPWGFAPGPPSMTLSRVDLTTGKPQAMATISPATRLAVGLGAVWVADGEVIKIDPVSGKTEARWAAPPREVQVGCGWLWFWRSVTPTGSQLARVDPSTGAALNTFDLADEQPRITEVGGRCWLTLGPRVFPLDPARGVTGRALGPFAGELMSVGGGLWFVDRTQHVISHPDPASQRVTHSWLLPAGLSDIGTGPMDARLLAAGGNLWLLTGTELIRLSIPTTD